MNVLENNKNPILNTFTNFCTNLSCILKTEIIFTPEIISSQKEFKVVKAFCCLTNSEGIFLVIIKLIKMINGIVNKVTKAKNQ